VTAKFRRNRRIRTLLAALVVGAALVWPAPPARADSYVRISGEGSTWAANAINQMIANVAQFGIVVDYNGDGSSKGRVAYDNGDVDFAASDIPFQFHPEDGSAPDNPPPGYAYMPITAGGTSFIYNLKINGQRVVNLRLSGLNVAKIFTGVITRWNDPALQADNPGLVLPDRQVVPVVRSDGSGSTAFLTMWMKSQYPALWNAYCQVSGRTLCGSTSFYPTIKGMIAQSGDDGVTSYVTASYSEGAIGYVNYSYAINSGFPVAKLLNTAGYYTEPTPENVAVSLLAAKINNDPTSQDYLTQDLSAVYGNPDPRNYALSSYSYLILPTQLPGPGSPSKFTVDKGKTLGAFSYYAMCQAQQQSASLGYSPMPVNLVEASFDQIKKIPGVVVQNINIASCHNPTFSPTGANLLATDAPFPPACDKSTTTQCSTGTAGARGLSTPVSGGGASPAGGGAAGGGAKTGGSSTGTGAAGTKGGAATSGSSGAAAGSNPSGASDPAAANGNTSACVDTCPSGSSSAASGATQVAAATPTVLDTSFGWSSKQLFVVLIILLTLALVLAPGLAWLYLGQRK
jgi:phosphate ABC transporter phosphate-binding protein